MRSVDFLAARRKVSCAAHDEKLTILGADDRQEIPKKNSTVRIA